VPYFSDVASPFPKMMSKLRSGRTEKSKKSKKYNCLVSPQNCSENDLYLTHLDRRTHHNPLRGPPLTISPPKCSPPSPGASPTSGPPNSNMTPGYRIHKRQPTRLTHPRGRLPCPLGPLVNSIDGMRQILENAVRTCQSDECLFVDCPCI
jgi:hypothetical protein